MNRLPALIPLALALAGCGPKPPKTAYPQANTDAKLNGNLPWNPRTGRVITSWVNSGGTMTTLFGDDAAIAYARTHADSHYPAGARLGAITWKQQEDPRWFGGNIPSNVDSVELVTAGNNAQYSRYEGSQLKQTSAEDTDRTTFLLEQRAAVMP